MQAKKCGSCLEGSFDPPFWPSLYQVSQNKTLLKDNTLYTDLNERESREMKTCDEHFHFYDILLCDFETKPTKKILKHSTSEIEEYGLWLFHCTYQQMSLKAFLLTM